MTSAKSRCLSAQGIEPSSRILDRNLPKHYPDRVGSSLTCHFFPDVVILEVDAVGFLQIPNRWKGSTGTCQIVALGSLERIDSENGRSASCAIVKSLVLEVWSRPGEQYEDDMPVLHRGKTSRIPRTRWGRYSSGRCTRADPRYWFI